MLKKSLLIPMFSPALSSFYFPLPPCVRYLLHKDDMTP